MKYELKEGEGSLFRNDKKSAETDPDYNGSTRLNGTDCSINGWKKQSQERRFIFEIVTPAKGRGN